MFEHFSFHKNNSLPSHCIGRYLGNQTSFLHKYLVLFACVTLLCKSMCYHTDFILGFVLMQLVSSPYRYLSLRGDEFDVYRGREGFPFVVCSHQLNQSLKYKVKMVGGSKFFVS